jgi:hypothetical protein
MPAVRGSTTGYSLWEADSYQLAALTAETFTCFFLFIICEYFEVACPHVMCNLLPVFSSRGNKNVGVSTEQPRTALSSRLTHRYETPMCVCIINFQWHHLNIRTLQCIYPRLTWCPRPRSLQFGLPTVFLLKLPGSINFCLVLGRCAVWILAVTLSGLPVVVFLSSRRIWGNILKQTKATSSPIQLWTPRHIIRD